MLILVIKRMKKVYIKLNIIGNIIQLLKFICLNYKYQLQILKKETRELILIGNTNFFHSLKNQKLTRNQFILSS